MPLDQTHALFHAQQPEMSACLGGVSGIKAYPVVANRERDQIVLTDQFDLHLCRPGMTPDVAQTFLDDTVDTNSEFSRQYTHGVLMHVGTLDPGTPRKIVDQ